MKLTTAAINTLAQCISRGELLDVDLGDPTNTHLWCDTCQDLTAVTMPMQGISENGVYDLGEVRLCINNAKH